MSDKENSRIGANSFSGGAVGGLGLGGTQVSDWKLELLANINWFNQWMFCLDVILFC